MNVKQKTLKNKITKRGFGINSKKEIIITLKPSIEDSGYVFVRTDLEGTPHIKANINYLTTTNNQELTLEKKNIKIYRCEYILSALISMDLDNVIIELTNNEIPKLNGTFIDYIKAIEKVGIIDQKNNRKYFIIKDTISYYDPISNTGLIAFPNHKYEIITLIDFKNTILKPANAKLKNLSDFKEQITSIKMFKFLNSLQNLLDQGLIKKHDINNNIIINNKQLNQNTIKKNIYLQKDKIEQQANKNLNDLILKYPNEIAKYTLLDLMGYLSLCGIRLKAKIIAYNPNHYINIQFIKKIHQKYKLLIKQNITNFNLNTQPIYNINEIIKILPHRYPLLMIDKVIEISNNHIIGIKNVTFNEPYFIGHFPKEPIMPGILQIEGIAQTGAILVLSKQKDPENFSTYFIKISNVKFKKKIIPGDTIIFKVKLLKSIKKGIVHMQGYAYVNNTIVSEGVIIAKIIRNKS